MAISPARIAAFEILLRVETQEAFASELLHSERVTRLSSPDRNLATQIVMGTLRWQSRLDSELGKFTSGRNEIAKLDAEVRTALRIAVFQLRFLDRIPQSAAVNDSVALVKRARKTSAAGLVNAVLRKLEPGRFPEPQTLASAVEIAGTFAHPLWMVERWAAAFGIERTKAICEADQQQPQMSLRFPTEREQALELEAELLAAGVQLEPGRLVTSARRLVSGDVTATAAFRERRIAIQDEASQLVAAMVGRGERILDCCAAPGGKTSVMAANNPQASIVAAELHPARARVMREMITAKNVQVIAADVTSLEGGAGF